MSIIWKEKLLEVSNLHPTKHTQPAMNSFLQYLKNRPSFNAIILTVYYILVVLPHEQVGLWTVDIFGHLTRDTYNLIIIVAAIIGLLLYAVPLVLNIIKSESKILQSFYLLSTIFFATITINFLFVINIEVVHFLQYGVFAMLCFPLIQNYILTLTWVTLAGAIDEAYQYFYLSPQRTDYYDFNDVVTNLIGGAFGLLLIRSFAIKSETINFKSFFQTTTFKILALFFIALSLLIATGYLSIYPIENSDNLWSLVRKMPPGFWSNIHPNVTYHVMLPIEGTIITILMILFYRKIGNGLQ